jgi:hypothetical protein
VIVTFTSIPPRFGLLAGALAALEGQRLRPDAVELYLPRRYRRFPGERPALPTLPDWVRVIETDADLGPATKVLPALDRWAGRDVDILFCDDDTAHDVNWTTRFAAMRRDRPDDVLCEYGLDLDRLLGDPSLHRPDAAQPRAVSIPPRKDEIGVLARDLREGRPGRPYFSAHGYVDVLMGFRGAMLRPGWIDPLASNIPPVCWAVDDVWLSGMIALAGRRIWGGGAACWMTGVTAASQVSDLYRSIIDRADRATANRLCAMTLRQTHGIWR